MNIEMSEKLQKDTTPEFYRVQSERVGDVVPLARPIIFSLEDQLRYEGVYRPEPFEEYQGFEVSFPAKLFVFGWNKYVRGVLDWINITYHNQMEGRKLGLDSRMSTLLLLNSNNEIWKELNDMGADPESPRMRKFHLELFQQEAKLRGLTIRQMELIIRIQGEMINLGTPLKMQELVWDRNKLIEQICNVAGLDSTPVIPATEQERRLTDEPPDLDITRFTSSALALLQIADVYYALPPDRRYELHREVYRLFGKALYSTEVGVHSHNVRIWEENHRKRLERSGPEEEEDVDGGLVEEVVAMLDGGIPLDRSVVGDDTKVVTSNNGGIKLSDLLDEKRRLDKLCFRFAEKFIINLPPNILAEVAEETVKMRIRTLHRSLMSMLYERSRSFIHSQRYKEHY